MGIKVLTVVFALFALRRVVARYRKGGSLTIEFVFWSLVFTGIGVVVFVPSKTDRFAMWLGVSSGFNALTFLAILGLLFTVYRLISRLHAVERDMTRLVRTLALMNPVALSGAESKPRLHE